MRIDAFNQINHIYKATETTQVRNVSKASATDKLEISQTGRDYQIAKKALETVPDVRQDKIDAVKARIDSGNYDVSADDFANKLLESFRKLDF